MEERARGGGSGSHFPPVCMPTSVPVFDVLIHTAVLVLYRLLFAILKLHVSTLIGLLISCCFVSVADASLPYKCLLCCSSFFFCYRNVLVPFIAFCCICAIKAMQLEKDFI